MSTPGGGAAASSATLVGLEAMKVTELRSRCAALGEPTDGRKVDLVARLYTAVTRRPPPPHGAGPPPHGAGPPPRHKRKRPLEEGDERLVNEVRGYMKANKLSQVMVGQEARISQAVISQWLSRKYHGHNAKVDSAMRHWLSARRAGRLCMPSPDEPTSVLRPSRSTTFAEKRVRERRRIMAAAESSGFGPGALSQLMQVAAQAEHNEPAGDPPNAADLGGTPTRPEINVGDDVFQLAELAAQTMVDLEASPSKPPPGRKLVSPEPRSERGRNGSIGAALILSEPIQQPPAEAEGNRIVSNLSRCYSSELGAEALTASPGIGARSTEGDGAYRQSPPISPQPNSPRAREQTPSHGAKSLAGTREPGSGASEEASIGELAVLSPGR